MIQRKPKYWKSEGVWKYILRWITWDARSEAAKRCAVHKYVLRNSKLDKLSCRIIQGILLLLASDGLEVFSCLSALNCASLAQNLTEAQRRMSKYAWRCTSQQPQVVDKNLTWDQWGLDKYIAINQNQKRRYARRLKKVEFISNQWTIKCWWRRRTTLKSAEQSGNQDSMEGFVETK